MIALIVFLAMMVLQLAGYAYWHFLADRADWIEIEQMQISSRRFNRLLGHRC